MNSATEAICSLTPMITIPLVGDQNDVAASLMTLGAAYTIYREQLVAEIPLALKSLLENWHVYQGKLSEIRDTFTAPKAIEDALSRIENLSKKRTT